MFKLMHTVYYTEVFGDYLLPIKALICCLKTLVFINVLDNRKTDHNVCLIF